MHSGADILTSQSMIDEYGQAAMRVRKSIKTYGEYDEPASYNADEVLGFRCIIDNAHRRRHHRVEEGDVPDSDLRILCWLDDTGTELDVEAVKDGLPDQIHFRGIYDVLRKNVQIHPFTDDRMIALDLRQREHVKTTMTVNSISSLQNGQEGEIDLTLTAENGEDIDGSDIVVEVLDDGTWTDLGFTYDVSTYKATISQASGDYELRIRYMGDGFYEGKIYYDSVNIEEA